MLDQEWREKFVYESNKIDPQPGHVSRPGDASFDDHMKALEHVLDAGKDKVLLDPKTIHLLLMRNLQNMKHEAGVLRSGNVMVGGRLCPDWQEVPDLLADWWKSLVFNTSSPPETPEDKKALVWDLHIDYEHIHPFIDGNGRSGRLLMVNHALFLGIDPWIVEHRNVMDYYARF